jgi:ergothioneine biosynthesis protein EgtB
MGASDRPGDEALIARFRRVRAATEALAAPLEVEDTVVQTMPDVSPTKWHLAHTTWFFEAFVLRPFVPGHRPLDERYHHLFNSYYQTVGSMHPRAERGLLSRPGLAEIQGYRRQVGDALVAAVERGLGAVRAEIVRRIELGLQHEQQHQELILMDLKHVLGTNPLRPAYRTDLRAADGIARPARYLPFAGGLVEAGADPGSGFCFDNETPRHRTFVPPFELADRPVSNGDWLGFVRDGGYRRPELWLADGWARVQAEGWDGPLYWQRGAGEEFTLAGLRPLDLAAPVVHVSYFEAEAFARWAGARLPTEFEWELAAAGRPVAGNLLEADRLHPAAAAAVPDGPGQLFGEVWEWTGSAYLPYPGFRPLEGSLGEYNGKFMCGQQVLRGGSCATPGDHARATYRNFFYPHQRWAFAGLRLARDGS